MEETQTHIFQYFIDFVHGVIIESFSIGFLLGLVLSFLGLAVLALLIFIRIKGRRVSGTVAGAVQVVRIKTKTRDGETREEEKKTLYPVYRYTKADGTEYQERGSEGGTMTKNYATGQNVNLLVVAADGYDDVYDADSYGALYMGVGLFAFGGGIMALSSSAYNALGASALTVSLVMIFLVIRGVFSLFGQGKIKKRAKPYSKKFAPGDLKPIEDFLE